LERTCPVACPPPPWPVGAGRGLLSEAFAAGAADAGVTGFVLATLAAGAAPVLWVQDRLSRQEAGLPYLPGLAGLPLLRADLERPLDVLWAMEEGLRCGALAAVIGEVWGAAPVVDFVATRRLAMRAGRGGMTCWLIRRAAEAGPSAAQNRWRVASLPALRDPDDPRAPGDPRWQVELFRSRSRPPGLWVASHDRAADRLDLAAAVPDRALAGRADARAPAAAG
jgi:protein ImuA